MIQNQKMTGIPDHTATVKAIANCIGKTVSGIARVQFYYDNREDTDGMGDLEFTFDDNSYLTLSGLGDAESIKASNKNADIPDSLPITGQNSYWKKIDMKDDIDWEKIMGQTLQSAEIEWDIFHGQKGNPLSCVLHFNTDFVTFNLTSADANEFFVNKAFSVANGETRIEKIKIA
ncbi:MAG: hypothetical protein EPN85_03090 [Bacteroidetes bacterium]|nr:MAG: hypothetical protein EPN85_03090 [Bacteroidota bacterium]